MGRVSTGAWTTKECQRIELTYLLKRGILKKGSIIKSSISWTNDNSIGIVGYWLEDEKYIRLIYTQTSSDGTKKSHDYKIYLITVKSNLGKGDVLYFCCPESGKRCRILYSAYGSAIYKSRDTYQNKIYYPNQSCSKYYYWLTRYWATKEEVDKLKEKKYKSHYKGKKTKSIQRLEQLEERLDYYEVRKDDIFDKRCEIWGYSLF
jgi:hypothetical protein